MAEDYYDVLGVSRDADEEEIQQAFRKMAAKYHPDVSDEDDAEERFKKAKRAKEVLTDDEKRQMYDQLGHERFEEAAKRGATENGGAGAGPGGMGGMGGMGGATDVNDIFEQFFGGGGGRGGRGGPQPGRDLQTRVEISLEDAYEGVETEMTVRRPEHCDTCDGTGHPPGATAETCPECDGRGQVTQVQRTPFGRMQQTQTCGRCEGEGQLYDETCGDCGGDGTVRAETTLTLEIPAGIRDGQTLRMEGEGAAGEAGARKGDLLVEVAVDDHPDFERDGDDLHHDHAVSFPQAVFGDTVEVPTLDGTVEMDVPAGTQSGETFRLRDRGMPRLRGRGHGDLYVEVHVVTPESLNEEQREALEAFAEAGGEEIDVEQGFFERLTSSF